MESKKRDDAANGCAGKIRYNSLREAQAFVNSLNDRKKGKRMTAYQCKNCQGGFHIGHNTRIKMTPHNNKKFVTFVLDDKIKRVPNNPQNHTRNEIKPSTYTIGDVLNQLNIKL